MLVLLFLAIEDDEQSEFMVGIYDQYYPVMKKIALEKTYNKNDAEDVIQAAFLSLIKNIRLLQSFESFVLRVYIVRTVENKCIDFNRKGLRERDRLSTEDFDLVSEFVSDGSGPEDEVLREAEFSQLGVYMAKLPEKLRDVVLMKYIYSYDDQKIAKEIGIAKNSVRTYLARARKALAKVAAKEEANET